MLVREIFFMWQDIQPDGAYYNVIYFCDQLEVKDGEVAPASGWGVDHALSAWASVWKGQFLRIRAYNSFDLRYC